MKRLKSKFCNRYRLFLTLSVVVSIFVIVYHYTFLQITHSFFSHGQCNTHKCATTDIYDDEGNLNYVIFDANGYSGSLAFLSVIDENWRVLVVNLKDKSLLSTCEPCFQLNDDWVTSNVVKKWGDQFQEAGIESNGITLLAAIVSVLSKGAPWIYVSNRPVPIPYKTFTRITKREFKTGLVYQGPQSVFEPCNHFMDPFAWKGLGVHHIGNRYNIKEVSFHSVYYVINECFRKGMSQKDWHVSLDTRAPIPYTMARSYAAVDFKNVLVSKPNIWTLIASVFPYDVKNTKTLQINLMIQRILWETRSSVGFLPSEHNVGHACPTCDIQTSFENGGKDYLNNLTRWRCPSSDTLLNCFIKLSKENIVSNGESSQQLVSLWLSLLKSKGWVSDERHVFNNVRDKEKDNGIPVYFTPAKSLYKTPSNDSRPPNIFKNICSEKGSPYEANIPQRHKDAFEDVLLIIVFNWHLVQNIPHLDYTYGRHFKHRIYCSQNMILFEKEFEKNFNVNPVTYINKDVGGGFYGHRCIEAVMTMGYDVKGYLQIGDDVLLNVWNLPSLPYHKPWFQSKIRVADIHTKRVPSVFRFNNWGPWRAKWGRDASLTAFNHLHKLAMSPTNGALVSKFLTNISNITGCDHCLLYEASDVLYVPRSLSSNFTFFSEIFSRNGVFLELTIPTILLGLTSVAEVYPLRGNYLWYQDRELYPFFWTEFDHFHHSFKLSTRLKGKDGINFYCNKFLSKIDSDLRN